MVAVLADVHEEGLFWKAAVMIPPEVVCDDMPHDMCDLAVAGTIKAEPYLRKRCDSHAVDNIEQEY